MKVVLDTNVLLISLPSRSPYHRIIQSFNERRFQLVISTPIFLEYEEILSQKANVLVANNVVNALLEAPNIIMQIPIIIGTLFLSTQMIINLPTRISIAAQIIS